jgi:multidrug efflux system outer membrane protein
MKTTTWIAAAAALLAAGCAVGPDYQRPALNVPAQFPQDSGGSAALAADWWTVYGDAALNTLVDQALKANADIAQAVARVELAEAQYREAGGAALPSVNTGASGTRAQIGAANPNNVTGRTLTGNDFALSLSASYEIDLWGRIRRGTEAARASLLASQAARDTVRLTIASLVVQNWFALHAYDEQIVAAQATLKTRDDSLRLVGARLQGGTVSRLDVEQATVLRSDAVLTLRELQRQRALTQSTLGVLTGDGALVVPAAPLRAEALPPLPPAGLPSALLERRPDVKRAEEQLVAANAQIGVAKAAMFPTLSLTGALGQESTELSDLLKAPARFWSLGFGLALPLFDGGRIAARTDQAGARQREAVAAYQGAVSTAFKEVADALASLRAARESAADLAARDASARKALELAQARYKAGYTGYLELLEAERTATASQLELVRNRQVQLNASVDFIKALGGGWAGLGT